MKITEHKAEHLYLFDTKYEMINEVIIMTFPVMVRKIFIDFMTMEVYRCDNTGNLQRSRTQELYLVTTN